MKRIRTEYPGVFYREADRIGGKGKEKVFYVVFKKDGKVIEEKVGRQFADDMTPAKAARTRAARIEGRKKSRKEIREAQQGKTEKWTIENLWRSYKEDHPKLKGLPQDESRFKTYIKPTIARKEPSELIEFDIKIFKKKLSSKAPATIRNTIELARRIINYGIEIKYCPPPTIKIEKPTVNNIKTEDLSDDQLAKLLSILRSGVILGKDGTETPLDIDARDAMLIALSSGMRRGEIFKLQWADIDKRRGFITLRDPKGGRDQTIPLSDTVRAILDGRPRDEKSPFVFPARRKRKGDAAPHRVDAGKQFRAIRDSAGLPKSFRPLHGLRHSFASALASSGQVDLYTLQKLLTHKSPLMSQRYAHLRDDTLKRAANLAGSIVERAAANAGDQEAEARKRG